MAGEYLPPVVVEITGNTDGLVAAVAKAKAALDSLKGANGDVKINFDANTASLAKATVAADAMTAATNRTVGAGRRWTNWLAGAHMILTAFGANIIADTIGIVAFGIGAVAAFAPVVTAVGNLGATYGELNPLQRVATVQITDFMNQFRNANQTGIFAVFTGLLDMVKNHVGQSGGIIDQATQAFQNFVAMLRQDFASAPWQQLFARGSSVIQQDLTALFHLISSIIGVIPALFHDFNGLGLFFINTAAGILHAIAILGNASPGLARFAAMVFFVYRALRMLGQFNSGSMLMRALAPLAFSFKDLGAAASLARTEGLIPALSALTGFSAEAIVATGGVAALAAGIYYSNFVLTKHGIGLQDQISLMAQQDKATGYNLAGYEKLTAQLNALTHGTAQLSAQDKQGIAATHGWVQANGQLTQAQYQAAQTTNTLKGNLQYLEQTYHLTQAQAIQLAQKTGVNLTQAFAKGGGAAQQARLKVAAYEQTVKAAQNPTSTLGYDLGLAANKALGLTDRVTALTNAFNALLTPFANVIADTVTWKDGNLQLEAAVDKAHGKVNDMGTATQRLAATGLAQAITNTVNLSTATLQQTGSMQKAIQPVRNEIAVLEALHSKSAVVAQAIRYLQQYINSLHSKTITLTAIYQTIGSPLSANAMLNPGGHAAGTSSAPPGWAWVGEKGPELMQFRGGERVIPHQASMAMAAGANSGGQVIEKQPIVIMLDGTPIYEAVRETVYYKNTQNNVRGKNGSVQGRFGIR